MSTEISDPRGNVILRTDDVSFQVCATVLANASPVFRAMFSHGWKEDSAVRNADPDSPATIEFPGDDPDVLRIFIRTAHDQIVKVPREPEGDLLDRLVAFVDKYDCALSMRNYGEILIYRVLHTNPWMEDLWLLLQYAYVLKSETLFHDISQQLAVRLPGGPKNWHSAVDNIGPAVPVEGIIDKLDALCESNMDAIETTLMEPEAIERGCTCVPRTSIGGDYVVQLAELDIFPYTPFSDFWHISPLEIIQRAHQLPPAEDVSYTGGCRNCYILSELLAQGRVAARLGRAVSKGLCLACVSPDPCDKHPAA